MSEETKEIRGWILNILHRAQPYGASYQVIERTLLDLGFPIGANGLKSELMYLTQKGYTRLEEIERNGVKRRINYITPKGVDLLECTIDCDPGVMLVG